MTWWAFTLYIVALLLSSMEATPIIAIMTRRKSDIGFPCLGGCQYIASSYVKWVESAGGRAVALSLDTTIDEVTAVMQQVNGLLLPGGKDPLTPAARHAIATAVESNKNGDVFPVWGTCLGFEWLMDALAAEGPVVEHGFDAENVTYPVHFTPAAADSRMFTNFPGSLFALMETEPLAMNSHEEGVTPEAFQSSPSLVESFTVLATNTDRQGKPFISAVESKLYPIFGVQWHPEKSPFEQGKDGPYPYLVTNHSPDAVAHAWYLATTFITWARQSKHEFFSAEAEQDALISSHPHYISTQFYPEFMEAYICCGGNPYTYDMLYTANKAGTKGIAVL